jgi:hypothetical protein
MAERHLADREVRMVPRELGDPRHADAEHDRHAARGREPPRDPARDGRVDGEGSRAAGAHVPALPAADESDLWLQPYPVPLPDHPLGLCINACTSVACAAPSFTMKFPCCSRCARPRRASPSTPPLDEAPG